MGVWEYGSAVDKFRILEIMRATARTETSSRGESVSEEGAACSRRCKPSRRNTAKFTPELGARNQKYETSAFRPSAVKRTADAGRR